MHDAAHAGASGEAALYPGLPFDFEGERRNGIAFLEHDQTSGPTALKSRLRGRDCIWVEADRRATLLDDAAACGPDLAVTGMTGLKKTSSNRAFLWRFSGDSIF
jgi:hypothetical protein